MELVQAQLLRGWGGRSGLGSQGKLPGEGYAEIWRGEEELEEGELGVGAVTPDKLAWRYGRARGIQKVQVVPYS